MAERFTTVAEHGYIRRVMGGVGRMRMVMRDWIPGTKPGAQRKVALAAFLVGFLASVGLASAQPAGAPGPGAAAAPAAQAAPAPQVAPAPGAPGEDAIVLNFEGADIREVVHSLASALEINYLIDPRVEGQVTIRTTGRIPRSELFPIFNQILRSIGIAAVRVGEVYNIVPIADAKTRVIVSRSELARMTADDLFVVELVRVRNVAAEEMSNLLQPFITPGGDVIPFPRANFLIITDIASNVDRLREMIQLLDRDSFKELKARVYKIENANMEDLGQELIAVLETYGITGEAANERGVYAIPLVRLNSIAVLAFNDNAFDAVSYWLKLLDVPPDEDSRRTVRVYNVQNAKAADLAAVLNELYGSDGNSPGRGRGQAGQGGFGGLFGRASGGQLGNRRRATSASGRLGGGSQVASNSRGGGMGRGMGGGRGGGRGRGARPAGVLGGQPGRAGGGASSVVLAGGDGPLSFFKEEVRIVADEISNSLVILATKQDFEEVRKVLRDLDVVPRQVVIEILIAEIQLGKGLEMGIQTALTNSGGIVPQGVENPPDLDTSDTGAALGRVAAAVPGFDYGVTKRLWESGGQGVSALITDLSSFRVTLEALAEANRAKILASPHLLTADNREASINIGQSVPIITSQQQSTLTVSNVVNQVQYRDTGVILNILPQINSDGLVNLSVRQEVSKVLEGTSAGGIQSPTFTVREAETTAVVQDGDSLLIAGIIEEDTFKSRTGVPYLMDIPGLGQLFRFEKSRTGRRELIILLTPHVIRSRAEALEVTQGYKDRLWDVVDEIERTKGLKPPTEQQLRKVLRTRSRTTTAQQPRDLLPNRAWED